jgi:hypothetical protein
VMENLVREPHRSIKDWGILTHSLYLDFYKHVRGCKYCLTLNDSLYERYKYEIDSRIPPYNLN